MKFVLDVVAGVIAALVLNASQEKFKVMGYGIEAFNIGSTSFGWDDVIGIALGVLLALFKPTRIIGAGVVSGMIYSKIAEGTQLPQIHFN